MFCREKTDEVVCGKTARFQIENKEWVCEAHVSGRPIIINMNEVLAKAWEGIEPYDSDDL